MKAETVLNLYTDYYKAFKIAPKDKVQEKDINCKGKAHDDYIESHITQVVPQQSCSSYAVMVLAIVTVAMVDTTLKASEVANRVAECTSARAIARLVANQAIGPRTAVLTLLRALPYPWLLPLPR